MNYTTNYININTHLADLFDMASVKKGVVWQIIDKFRTIDTTNLLLELMRSDIFM